MSDVNDQSIEHSDNADPVIEREARRQGWRPADEFRGNEADWVDAATYVRRGKEIRAHVKAENERLARELSEAKATIGEMKGTIEEIREYHAQMEERAIATAIERMKKERRAAVAAGDNALAADIDDEIQELKDAPRMATKVGEKKDKKEDPPVANQKPAEITAWEHENAHWYNSDPENEDLVAYANGLAQKIGARTDLSLVEKGEELTRRVKATFPDRFGGSKPRAGVTPGGGEGGGSRRKSNNSVESLPDDAKQAGMRFVKQGLYKDIAAYAEEYWKQSGAR